MMKEAQKTVAITLQSYTILGNSMNSFDKILAQ